MADNKEALPVLPLSPYLFTEWATPGERTSQTMYTADQMRAFREAGVSELRAEVERYKLARDDIKALHQAQTINNQNYSNQWHEAIDAALEAFDAARSAASGESAEGGV